MNALDSLYEESNQYMNDEVSVYFHNYVDKDC